MIDKVVMYIHHQIWKLGGIINGDIKKRLWQFFCKGGKGGGGGVGSGEVILVIQKPRLDRSI